MLINPIAIRVDCLPLPFREAIEMAARLGARGVQFEAKGELAPDQLSQTGVRHVRHIISSHGLALAGLGFHTRHGYDHLDRLEGRIARTLRALAFARELGAPTVANQIGQIPEDADDPRSRHFFDALARISQEADRIGVRFAIETGGDSPTILADLLSQRNGYGLAVNYSPAHLLVRGHDAYEGVRQLADKIVGVRALDVLRSSISVSGYREAPMGEGEVDWPRLLGALADVDYRGYLTIEREKSENPAKDLLQAIEYLKDF